MLPSLLIVLCLVFRIVPHPPNFTPVGAAAVFAGRTLNPWMAMCLVGVAMFTGDVVLAHLRGYSIVSLVTPFVYGGFFTQVLLGRLLRSKKGGAIGAAALGSVSFFALSNFGVWIGSSMYAPSASGLLACYVVALPFFGGTFLGDVVWTVLLSAVYRPVAARLESRPFLVPVATAGIGVV